MSLCAFFSSKLPYQFNLVIGYTNSATKNCYETATKNYQGFILNYFTFSNFPLSNPNVEQLLIVDITGKFQQISRKP